MSEVLSKMRKIGGGRSGMGVGHYRPVWFVHTAASLAAMKQNYELLINAIKEQAGFANCWTVWVGGKPLFPGLEARAAGNRMYDPGQAWNHEIQRAMCWALNKGKVVVACARGEEYNSERWRAAAEADGGDGGCVLL